MAIRILDPNEIVFDSAGKVVRTNGDDALLWRRASELLNAMTEWHLFRHRVEPDIGPQEMLELVEEVVDFSYDEDNFKNAMDHLNIWCNVMKQALPHVTIEFN